jgi:serine/threonine kinase PknH
MAIEPLTSDDPGEVAGYRLRARLGAGGMGRVYLAFTPGGRAVALKMVRPELGDDREFRDRFRHEVEAARRVHGLYTAQVLEADPAAARPWLATAYVPGPSLREAVTSYGPMPVETVLVLMAGVAEALHAIHAAGVVHRDLKPSNVLLAPDGPRVIDFGISRAADATAQTGSGIRIGSPNYMAPEQVAGLPASGAADVFALGSLAAYAAAGRPAFGQGSELAVMYRVRHEPADLSGCPAPLRGIIERCLAKDAAERPTPAEIIRLCRAQTAGRTQQIAQPWLPPVVAAALAGQVPLLSPAGAARPGPTPAGAARPGPTPAGAARPSPTPAVPADGLPPPGRRRASPALVLAICAALLLAAIAGLLALKAAGAGGTGGSPAAGPPKSWLAGTWTGTADQPTGVVTHWTAELTFPAAGRTGTFRFPSLGCSGTLIVTSATRTTAAVREDLTGNPRKLCAPGGLMKLSRSSAGGMDMAWQDSTDHSNVAAAHLNRGVTSRHGK